MMKRRGSPDLRGMGAQSDFLSEQFVPSEQHRNQQLQRARVLIMSGIAVEEVARMLSLSIETLVDFKRGAELPESR